MSLNQLLDNGSTTPCLPWKKIKVYDLDACNEIVAPNADFDNVDVTTINGAPYPPGAAVLPALVANKLLRTNAAATAVLWGDVPQGAARQLLQTNAAATASEWTSNVDIPGTLDCTGNAVFDNDLAVTGELNVINGDVNIQNSDLNVTLGTANLLDVTITGDLEVANGAGTNGQALFKGPGNTQIWDNIIAADVTPGTANQVMVTNGAGTASQWSSQIDPENVNITGTTLALQFGGIGGTTGQFVKKNGANIPRWATFAVTDIPSGSSNQFLMSDAGGTTSTWATLPSVKTIRLSAYFAAQDLNAAASAQVAFETTPQYSLANSLVGSVTGITISSVNNFTFGTTGYYDLDLNVYFNQSSTGLGNSWVRISLNVGGTVPKTAITSGERGFCGKIPNVLVTAGQVVFLQIVRITGTNTLVTYDSSGAAPLYASTATWTLVNAVG